MFLSSPRLVIGRVVASASWTARYLVFGQALF